MSETQENARYTAKQTFICVVDPETPIISGQRPIAECVNERTAMELRDLLNQTTRLQARVDALSHQLEADRTKVAECVTAINSAIRGRSWLLTGRGSYEWDDDRYREEFGAAIDGITKAMEPLAKIAADWTECPKTSAEVAQARIDLQARVEELERGICETHKERLPSTVGCMVCEWLASCSAENLVRLERELDALTQERDWYRKCFQRAGIQMFDMQIALRKYADRSNWTPTVVGGIEKRFVGDVPGWTIADAVLSGEQPDTPETETLHIGVDLASGPDETRTYCYACGDSGCPACDPLPDFTALTRSNDGSSCRQQRRN